MFKLCDRREVDCIHNDDAEGEMSFSGQSEEQENVVADADTILVVSLGSIDLCSAVRAAL